MQAIDNDLNLEHMKQQKRRIFKAIGIYHPDGVEWSSRYTDCVNFSKALLTLVLILQF